jgi:head-to-tail connecting protein
MSEVGPSSLEFKLWKRAQDLQSKRRAVFDPQWQQISQYFWPDVSDINTEKTENTDSWFDRIYETTGIRAASTCSIGVRNWVTPSTEPWLDLSPPYNLTKGQGASMSSNPRVSRISSPNAPKVDENGQDEATRWCSETASQGLNELSGSAFYSVVQPFNRSACTFGTGLMFLEEGKQTLFKFEQYKVGTFCIAENDEKIVDTVIRWFKLTVRQACQKFCERMDDGSYDVENLPKKIQEAYNKQQYDAQFTFLHHVFPNEDFEKGKIGPKGMAFASVYQADMDKKIVKEGGYEEMPYFCLRWSRWGTDDQPWGCSPAFEALAEARQLNFVTQYGDAKVEYDVFPPLLYPDNLDGNIQLAAGSVMTYDHTKPEAVPKPWMPTGQNERSLPEMKAEKRKAMEDAFFIPVFKALGALGDKITQATFGAIAMLQGEMGDQFTGTFDQYRTELINPLVARMIGIMYRAGRLKDPPQSMMVQGKDPKAEPELAIPKIAIKSRVTLALRAAKNVGVQKSLEQLEPVLEQRQDAWDNIDVDDLVRNVFRDNGSNESVLRPTKAMQMLRAQRAKMQQEQNALHNAEIAATAAGKLGKAPPQFQKAAGDQLSAAQPQQAA